MKSDIIEIACKLLYKTTNAFLITDGTKDEKGELKKYWVPQSQCQWYEADGLMLMPEWLAKEKGLI